MFENKKQLLHEVKVEKANPQYAVLMQEQLGGGNAEVKQYLYRQVEDKEVRSTIDFLLNREEAQNALFR